MIDSVITQLHAAELNGKPLFMKVSEAIDLGRAMKAPLQQSPVAYVIEVSRRPGNNGRDMGLALQKVTTTIGVVIGVSKINDSTGSKAKAIVGPVLKQTRAALFGFAPTDEHAPFLLGAADTVGVTESALWQLERFTTEHYEESVNG